MKGNEAAKSLAELAADAEPPEEVFRVGYKICLLYTSPSPRD